MQHIILYLKGALMGLADLIPGVSGGTIALLTGIYEKLLNTIKSCDAEAIRLLFKGEFKKLWKHVNGNFLVVLLAGVGTSIVLLPKLIHQLLTDYPVQVWSFFFGLVLISAYLVAKNVRRWGANRFIPLLAGAGIAYAITTLTPASTPDSAPYIFGAGAIAICAMILPGISGSFILLILGKYAFVIEALHEKNLRVIVIFALGCLTGILSFSRLISWLLKRFHDQTIALLTGFMLGSLNKIWPWKQVLETRLNSKGVEVPLVEQSILPSTYTTLTEQPSHTLAAVILGLSAFVMVYAMEHFASQKNSQQG